MRFTLALLFSLITLTGCAGYRLGNIQGSDMRGVRTIYVPTVKNYSYTANVPTMVTNAILRRLDNDGTFQSSRSRQADATLEVSVVQVTKNPLRSARTDILLTEEYELVLEAKATLTNLKTGQRVFTDRLVKGRTTFYIQQNGQEAERQALPNAADQLANNLVSLITEGW